VAERSSGACHMRMKLAPWIAFTCTGLALLTVLDRNLVGRDVSSVRYSQSTEQLRMSSEVSDVFRRACLDCHSNHTQWPWYSQLPPASWILTRDVQQGRRFFNSSNWEKYSRGMRLGVLASMVEVARNRTMPPASYQLLHPEARLDQYERDLLAGWAKQEWRLTRTRVLTP
jgi:hypothetical protein